MGSPRGFDAAKEWLSKEFGDPDKNGHFHVQQGAIANVSLTNSDGVILHCTSGCYSLNAIYQELGGDAASAIISGIDEVRKFFQKRGYQELLENDGPDQYVSALIEIIGPNVTGEVEYVIQWAREHTNTFTDWLHREVEPEVGFC